MSWREATLAAGMVTALAASVASQTQQPSKPLAPLFRVLDYRAFKTIDRDDYRELHVFGGFRVTAPELALEVRGENALVLFDLEAFHALVEGNDANPPRREIEPPAPRRRLTNDDIRDRLVRAAQAFGNTDPTGIERIEDRMLEAVRYVYCENGVVVVRNGVEVLRCDRLWISPLDDRIVVENA